MFLCRAALHGSWAAPFAATLSATVGILGAPATAHVFGQWNDVRFKVGLLTTIGLAARNAILSVAFAQDLRLKGTPSLEAIVTASRMRLRPILMTTFAFRPGVPPPAPASGAGADARRSIGIGVLGGVAASALVGIVLAPVFYAAALKLTRADRTRKASA